MVQAGASEGFPGAGALARGLGVCSPAMRLPQALVAVPLLVSLLVPRLARSEDGGTPKQDAQDPVILRARVLQALMAISREPLEGHAHCDFQTALPGPLTVGSFIAWNLSFLERGVDNSVSVTCDGLSTPTALCSISFNADSAGESPWSCGYRFKLKTRAWTVDRASLECIGTC